LQTDTLVAALLSVLTRMVLQADSADKATASRTMREVETVCMVLS
jgi:hypothetical protein